MTWLKRTDGHEFSGAEFRVLIAIFNHSGADGSDSHPGLKLLMEETGYGKTAVSQALTSLQERGWIFQSLKGSGTSGRTSVYHLVHLAPQPSSWFAGVNQPTDLGWSAGANQLPGVGSVERTSWFAGANRVGSLERTPTDPDNRSGSDPFRSDQKEKVHYPVNQESEHEDSSTGCPLSVAGSEATADPEGFRPSGLMTLNPSTAQRPSSEDPFSSAPTAWALEQRALEERAAEQLQTATAGSLSAPAWN